MQPAVGVVAESLMDHVEWFVDKTNFIKEFVQTPGHYLILRPRRFGKSTNLRMLQLFLSNMDARRDLFTNYHIYQDQEFFQKHFKQYPVVHLSFKDLNQASSWEEMKMGLWEGLKMEAEQHDLPNFGFDLNQLHPPENMEYFLLKLSRKLRQKYGKEVYVLIDEYDAPLNNAFFRGFYPQASKFFGTFLSLAIKDNPCVLHTCLMGIVEVHGVGILSGLNHLNVCSIFSTNFSEYFGFLEDEIDRFCTDKITHSDLMDWYNGYSIGNKSVLNPWSVGMAANKRSLDPHWIHSATIVSLLNMFFLESSEVVAAVISFLRDPEYRHQIERPSPIVNYGSECWSSKNVWSFLISAGYLTFEPNPADDYTVFAKIPNHELRLFWRNNMETLFRNDFEKVGLAPSGIVTAFLKQDHDS